MSKRAIIEGIKEGEDRMNKILKGVKNQHPKTMTDVVMHLLGESIDEAPILEGDLKGSGYADVNGTRVAQGVKGGGVKAAGESPRQEKLEGEVGFSLPYALRQHEHTEYVHPQDGKAKYLEDPFKRNEKKFIKAFADDMKKATD